nr:unnamed protein product [Callosobruchus analis]
MSLEDRIFNYRLSRGRRIIENVFGIMAHRFRILLTIINLAPEKVQDITLACCALHNYLTTEDPSSIQEYTDNNYVFNNRSRQSCLDVREKFKEYFNNEGAETWHFILLYEQHPCLYSYEVKSELYKNKIKRLWAWREITEQFNKSFPIANLTVEDEEK